MAHYRVPTLKEVLSLVKAAELAGKTVGVAIHTLVRILSMLPSLSNSQCLMRRGSLSGLRSVFHPQVH